MDYEHLLRTYWDSQRQRIEALRAKISQRPKIGDGRVVPDDDDLLIGDGRRLPMAVMFIDICDFSSRAMSTLDEQDLMLRVLSLFFSELVKLAEEYGGHVEKNTGDGLMIYFADGEGTPPEGGTKRAVTCALTMLAATEYLINPIIEASKAKPIQFRISMEHGFVTVARLGSPRRFNSQAAIGSTANFASKMLRHAGAGQIVMGARARGQLPKDWQDRYTTRLAVDTGWVYTTTNEPYPLYGYNGRWQDLR